MTHPHLHGWWEAGHVSWILNVLKEVLEPVLHTMTRSVEHTVVSGQWSVEHTVAFLRRSPPFLTLPIQCRCSHLGCTGCSWLALK